MAVVAQIQPPIVIEYNRWIPRAQFLLYGYRYGLDNLKHPLSSLFTGVLYLRADAEIMWIDGGEISDVWLARYKSSVDYRHHMCYRANDRWNRCETIENGCEMYWKDHA